MIKLTVVTPEKPYILADDFSGGYGTRIAVVRRSDRSVAGYLLKTEGGWITEAPHPSYTMADGSDPMNRVYQNPDEAAVLVYMCGRAYRKSYSTLDDPSGGLDIFVTFIVGQWVASVRERKPPCRRVVPDVCSPLLEEAKFIGLRKAHYVLFNRDEDPTGEWRACAQEGWTDVQLPSGP